LIPFWINEFRSTEKTKFYPMRMILITGHVILTPEHRERMIALGAEHSARSRGEAGCLAHNCHIPRLRSGQSD
jgi:quinol monooxygenase YgiN